VLPISGDAWLGEYVERESFIGYQLEKAGKTLKGEGEAVRSTAPHPGYFRNQGQKGEGT